MQCDAQAIERRHGRVFLAALKSADERPIEASIHGQGILAQAERLQLKSCYQ
jgi:hypothetical protein